MKKLLRAVLFVVCCFSVAHCISLDRSDQINKKYIIFSLKLQEDYFIFHGTTGGLVHKNCLQHLTDVQKFVQEVKKYNWWSNKKASEAVNKMIYDTAAEMEYIDGPKIVVEIYKIIIRQGLHAIANPKGLFVALRKHIKDCQSDEQLRNDLGICGCDMEGCLSNMKYEQGQ